MKTLVIRRFPELDYSGKEAINTLCTNLTLSGEHCKRIMMTSLLDAEGKTFLSMQILRTLSGLGKRVLLIDADLRRSTIDATYRIQYTSGEKLGLAHYLTKKCEMNDIIYATDLLRAYYIPSGYVANNSLALLNAARFKQLLDQISHLTDFIIVDAPPIGMIVDALEIAKSCDGAVFVIGYNQVHRKDLFSARCEIEKTGCEVLGTVINNVPKKHYMQNDYQRRKNYRGYYLER